MSEKRKKSWKEIDRQRDRSQHRREDRPSESRTRGLDHSRSHRSALDQLFSSGKVAELVKQRDAETGVAGTSGGPSRRALTQAILEADHPRAKTEAIDAYLKAFSMPRDLETLAHVLDHPDDEVLEEALEQIAALLAEQGPPRRSRTLRAQLKNVAELSEWGKLRRRAQALLDQL